ncbi:MAG: hypothetical protein CVU54_11815 [Deltaproteobacteria bacterium HGW-Deltaproteobacteria-12]|jgi:hypothetical protein|nr:MAG: hypothetical protein CVU54_11815 [Deltaproteobacteria bacterium HGW-Deltaproteobacteria-12]
MKKAIMSVLAGVMSLLLIGCAGTSQAIHQSAQSQRMDVFMEIKNDAMPAQGFVILTIKATIKTHLERYYALESKESVHGKPGYPFVINIDGQAATWKVDGQKESLPRYDKNGETSRDPDAGEGIKYVLEKKIQLRPGAHKVFFSLPADDYFKEVEVSLKEGNAPILEFRPVYKYKTLPTRIPTFVKGIRDYEVYWGNTKI